MKAALWYNRNDIRIEETQEPRLMPGKVKIKVKWCGICGTDIHEYLAGPIIIPVDQPHPVTGDKAPVILGHEFSGDVVELGEGVQSFSIGDRVVVEPLIPCGKCHSCKAGNYNTCSMLACVGLSFSCGGGFAEYAVIEERFVHKLPDSVSYEEGALVEPLTVGLHAVRQAKFAVGETALVVGCGPIGLCTIANLRAAGASLIIAVEKEPIRIQYAKNVGADYVFNPDEVNVCEKVMGLTEGRGVNAAFETSTAQSGFDIGLGSIKTQGVLVIIGVSEGAIQFNPNAVLFTEKLIIGSSVYRSEFPMTLGLMADGRIKVDQLITKKIFVDDLVKEGLDILPTPKGKEQLKILVTPDKSLL